MSETESFVKKKKKRSFVQNAKKFGRQRNNEKVKQLSEEEYDFFITVFQHLKDPEFEEKDIIIKNFFRSIEDEVKLKKLVCDPIVSRILDEILPMAPAEKIIHIMDIISQDLRIYCTDSFASHVVQTLLVFGIKHIQKDAYINPLKKENSGTRVCISDEEQENITLFLVKTSKFVYNNLNEFITNIYASHVLRTIFEVCSGIEVSSAVKSSQRAQTCYSIKQDSKSLKIPDSLLQIVKDLIIRITQLPNFVEVVCSESGSAALQTALLVLNSLDDVKNTKLLLHHIINQGFAQLTQNDTEIHPVFEENSTTRLLEVIILAASGKRQAKIYRLYFEGKLSELVKHKLGNFVVQKLLTSWKNADSFAMLFDSVSLCLDDALSANHTGVALALVQACSKLSMHQSRCLKNLMEYLQCSHSDSVQLMFVPCLLYFRSLPQYIKAKESSDNLHVSLHGSLIIQEFLRFKKPIKVVLSILGMSLADLQIMSCDPRGSHIVDTFIDSTCVGEKNKEKFIQKFQDSYTILACNKHGSRSIEAMWRIANVKLKTSICNELQANSSKVLDSPFGKCVYKNFQVNLFKMNNKSDWEELQSKNQKKRQLLKEFLKDADSVEVVKPKKKAKKDVSSEMIIIDTEGDLLNT